MGVVYKARQQSLERDVALKVIKDEIAAEPEYRERFLREAKLAASVDHPHVVTVYDVGDEDGRLFLAMQWIDGSDLRQVLDSSGRLTPKRAVAIGEQLAGALDAVHEASGLVHRDVKPANVLLREVGGEDHAYLTDFGVAKPPEALEALTRTGSTVGTTGYLAPEQIQGKEAGPRSDLYSLGCVTFEMLTGKTALHRRERTRRPLGPRPGPDARWSARPSPRSATATTASSSRPSRSTPMSVSPRAASSPRVWPARRPPPATPTRRRSWAPRTQPRRSARPRPRPRARGHQAPPPYGYVTPPPQPQHRERSGSPTALIVLGIVAIVGITAAVLAATGVFSKESSANSSTTAHTTPKSEPKQNQGSGGNEEADASPRQEGRAAARLGILPRGLGTLGQPVHDLPLRRKHAVGLRGIRRLQTLSVYSPVTGKTYAMTCKGRASSPVRAATTPPSTSAPPRPAARTRLRRHGSNPNRPRTRTGILGRRAAKPRRPATRTSPSTSHHVSVRRERVRRLRGRIRSFGESGFYEVEAFSDTTGESYVMDCYDEDDFIECTGGTEALVTFPLQAVREY